MNTYISKDINRFNYLLSETDAVYHDMSKRLGLSDSISQILYTICDLGDGCLLQEICRRCGLSKQTVNSAIRRLESDGCLYLEAAGARNKKACLTDPRWKSSSISLLPPPDAPSCIKTISFS